MLSNVNIHSISSNVSIHPCHLILINLLISNNNIHKIFFFSLIFQISLLIIIIIFQFHSYIIIIVEKVVSYKLDHI